MSLAPLLAAGPVITGHAAAAGAALLLGIVQLVRGKGTPAHRALGWVWLALMAFVAGGSFAMPCSAGDDSRTPASTTLDARSNGRRYEQCDACLGMDQR